MLKQSVVTFLRKLHTRISDDDSGFTLVEAIVSVAIVGAVITPIAIIFQGSLENSIETRTKLKANQLVQQYVEAVEVMEYDTLERIVEDNPYDDGLTDGGLVTQENTDDYGLPELPDNMTVIIDVMNDVTDPEYNGESMDAFKMPADLVDSEGTEALVDDDLILYMGSASDNSVRITDRNDVTSDFNGYVIDRILELSYEYHPTLDAYRRLVLQRDDGVSVTKDYAVADITGNIVIQCDDVLTSVSDRIDTTVRVTNMTDTPVSIYVFETINDRIQPVIEIVNGNVTSLRNLAMIEITTHRIYEVEVTILEDDEVLTKIVTTVKAK